jgi:PKD repeat protein
MEIKIDYITVEEEPVPAPIITDFTIFDNSSSPTIAFKQTNDYADTIRWDFGDGNINNNVQASQNVIQHTYTETGTYTVNITAFNSEGQDSEELEVTIESIPTPPISDFSINLLTNEHELPATIQLIDNSSHTTEWNWDTNGDGIFELNTETPENITFYEYGTHQITLEVSNEYGSDSTTKSITLSTDKADISGSVEWLDNAKINEATVELYHSNGTLYSSCTTDSNGDYTFTDVPLGEYDIKIIKDGFYPEVQGISALSDSVPMGSKNVQKFGDIDDDGRSSGATDLTLMLQASVSDIQGDRYFDLNEDGRNADACDLTLMLQACVGDITF